MSDPPTAPNLNYIHHKKTCDHLSSDQDPYMRDMVPMKSWFVQNGILEVHGLWNNPGIQSWVNFGPLLTPKTVWILDVVRLLPSATASASAVLLWLVDNSAVLTTRHCPSPAGWIQIEADVCWLVVRGWNFQVVFLYVDFNIGICWYNMCS